MRYIITALLLFALSISFNVFAQNITEEKVQLAILLDTSGSMEGLIEQAKTQLWSIVNELALAKKNGQTPALEVALFEYGKSSLKINDGYIKQISTLTKDLDKISEELFKLKTNGGDEYCGWVIKNAVNQLPWSKSNDDLKIIYIAGNEPFTQGDVDYKKSCKSAISKGIIINTIFCGDIQEGIDTKWKHGAELADGKFINIDHNQQLIYIKAPQDEELARLGDELNKTYLSYGTKGTVGRSRQLAQDKNVETKKEASIQRVFSKASKMYNNSSWDLVDAVEDESINLNELKDQELPEEMKKMTQPERDEYIKELSIKRKEIQGKINILRKERDKYIATERKKQSKDNTLGKAVKESLKIQAQKKNFEFEN